MASASALRTGWPTARSSTCPKATAVRRLLSGRRVRFAGPRWRVRFAGPALLLLLAFASAAAANPIRVAFLYSDGNLPGTLKAYKALLKERPDLKDQVSFTFLTESVFDEVKPLEIGAADVLVFDQMNEQMLQRYN